MSAPWFPALRDRLACWLCNAILSTLATPHYRKMIGGSIRYGLNAAARDAERNRQADREAEAIAPVMEDLSRSWKDQGIR